MGKCNRREGAGPPRFSDMVERCYEYAQTARDNGRPIVGITCEYTPRELIMAAGAVPVCLCGGDADMIPAAERELPANLCPLIKSTYGYHLERANPFLEMAGLIVAETTCDGKKKMYELLARERPVYVMELPQKSDDPDALRYWTVELKKLTRELERRFRVTVSDAKLRTAVKVMNRERALRRRLAGLMKRDRPPLTGLELLSTRSIISGMPEFLADYGRLLDGLEKSPGKRGLDGRVRVLLTGVPTVHGAERVPEIIETHGGLIVCMENCTGLKPILEDVDASAPDLFRALAAKYYHLPCSVMTSNRRRIESLRDLVREYRPQCVIDLVWQNCLTYDVESFLVRKFVQEEAGLPYLKIQTDYSPSDSARIAIRVEALMETARRKFDAVDGKS